MELNKEQKSECTRLADMLLDMMDDLVIDSMDTGLAGESEEDDDAMDIVVEMKEETFRIVKAKLTDYLMGDPI